MTLSSIREFIVAVSENELKLILTVIASAFYIAVTTIRIYDRHRYYMSQLMEYVDDKLYSIKAISTERFTAFLRKMERYNPDTALAFSAVLHSCLLGRTRSRIKQAILKNGFYSKTGDELLEYVRLVGERLHHKNQNDLVTESRHLACLIEQSQDVRFTLEESVQAWGDIVKMAKEYREQEKKDIVKLVFFWRVK